MPLEPNENIEFHEICKKCGPLRTDVELIKKDTVKIDGIAKCVQKMLPKKTIWATIPILLMVGAMAIGAADFKYAQKSEVEEIKRQHERFKSDQTHIKEDIEEIKDSQKTTAEDIRQIKEILMNR